MWSPSSPSSSLDAEQRFPRRPRRAIHHPIAPSPRRSSATSLLEQLRRDLPPFTSSTERKCALNATTTEATTLSSSVATAAECCVMSQDRKQELCMDRLRNSPFDDYGVIGSMLKDRPSARMLFSRPEREEEEREEEALPSYLSYLQAPSMSGESATASAAAAVLSPMAFDHLLTRGQTHVDPMQSTSQELVKALQDFVLVQMRHQRGAEDAATLLTSSGPQCNCAWRVAELEKQVESLIAAKHDKTRPRATDETGNAMGDRVSTLEGRQSAFQSQLAQISKVLGVSMGKHGKSSQLKTLVQTLHEEIDAKVHTAIADMEATCVASMTVRDEKVVAEASAADVESPTPSGLDQEKEEKLLGDCSSVPQSGLAFSTVLNALAVEHGASLTRLNAHFDERLRLEGLQRVALEGRVQARLGEVEEWLQQVEGELGGSRFGSTSSSSIAALADEMTRLQAYIAKVEASCNQQHLEVIRLSAKLKKLDHFEDLGGQLDQQKDDVKVLREDLRTFASLAQKETQAVARTSQGLKFIVEKLLRDTGSAEELLRQYVSTITHQVASVTRQYVSVRIRDNNRLLDATLRARIPDYVSNESEGFLLVCPETKNERDGCELDCEVTQEPEESTDFSFGLREDANKRI